MVLKNIMDRLIPPKYDFYSMLTQQAEATAAGVNYFVRWLETPSSDNYQGLMKLADEADSVRLNMEDCLGRAFSTPFDRQDMYVFSVRMDRVIEIAKSTAMAIEAFGTLPDHDFINMANHLSISVNDLAQATARLSVNPNESEECIEKIRQSLVEVGNLYRIALPRLFAKDDPIEALKAREVFNELKDAAEWMELTVDLFHKIIVRLV